LDKIDFLLNASDELLTLKSSAQFLIVILQATPISESRALDVLIAFPRELTLLNLVEHAGVSFLLLHIKKIPLHRGPNRHPPDESFTIDRQSFKKPVGTLAEVAYLHLMYLILGK
jgi:hypothetical protein